jgi:hypothetical protein
LAESPKKGSGNTLILGLILCLIFGVVGYVVYDKYLKGKLAIGTGGNTNLNTGNGSGSGGTVIIDNNASQSGSGLSLPKIVLIIAAVAVLILGFMYYRSTQP